jgi:hypothetical protein
LPHRGLSESVERNDLCPRANTEQKRFRPGTSTLARPRTISCAESALPVSQSRGLLYLSWEPELQWRNRRSLETSLADSIRAIVQLYESLSVQISSDWTSQMSGRITHENGANDPRNDDSDDAKTQGSSKSRSPLKSRILSELGESQELTLPFRDNPSTTTK